MDSQTVMRTSQPGRQQSPLVTKPTNNLMSSIDPTGAPLLDIDTPAADAATPAVSDAAVAAPAAAVADAAATDAAAAVVAAAAASLPIAWYFS